MKEEEKEEEEEEEKEEEEEEEKEEDEEEKPQGGSIMTPMSDLKERLKILIGEIQTDNTDRVLKKLVCKQIIPSVKEKYDFKIRI